MISTARRKPSTSKESAVPEPVSSERSRNFSRLMLARLHAELSRCMYSLQGFEPLMRPVLAAVCQRLIVVSNCMPGSAHSHAAWQIWRMTSRALTGRTTSPVGTAQGDQSAAATTAVMDTSGNQAEESGGV